MSTIYLSKNTNKLLINYLKAQGHRLILIPETALVYPTISSHSDIYLCKLGAEPHSPIFCAPSFDLLDIGYQYPHNIKYNAVCMGNFFIHNLKYTAPLLREKVHQLGYDSIHVKQGYTKCNMVVINAQSAITSDRGIYRAITNHPTAPALDILLVEPGHVKLSGFDTGFLGGASGRVGDEIIFNGNLKAHPNYKSITAFITEKQLKVKYFEEYPLEDLGSIIESHHPLPLWADA